MTSILDFVTIFSSTWLAVEWLEASVSCKKSVGEKNVKLQTSFPCQGSRHTKQTSRTVDCSFDVSEFPNRSVNRYLKN